MGSKCDVVIVYHRGIHAQLYMCVSSTAKSHYPSVGWLIVCTACFYGCAILDPTLNFPFLIFAGHLCENF